MKKLYSIKNKIISYSMILFLVINLFYSGGIVNAESARKIEVKITNVIDYGVYKENSKEISYEFIGDDGEASSYEYVLEKNKENNSSPKELIEKKGLIQVNGEGSYILTLREKSNQNPLAQIHFVLGKGPMPKVTLDHSLTNDKVVVTYESTGKNYKAYRQIEKDGKTLEKKEVKLSENTNNPYCLQAKEEFKEEGNYKVKFFITDINDTKIIKSTEHSFVIDQSRPEVQLEVKDDIENGINKKRCIIRAKEECTGSLNIKRTHITADNQLKNSTGKENIELNALNNFEQVFIFVDEGKYECYVNVKDQAGNEDQTPNKEFVIDHTAPKIKIEGIEKNATYGEEKEVTLNVGDLTLSKNWRDNYQIEIKRNGELETLKDIQWNQKQENFYTKTISFKEDGQYSLKVKVKDQLDNESTEEITFSIDQTAPEIVEKELKVAYKNGSKEPKKVIEQEKTTYYLNDDTKVTFKVKEKNYKDAKVFVETKKDGNSKSNKETYTMTKEEEDYSLFYAEEGKYQVKICAEDALKNKGKEGIRYFVIDKTKPIFTLSGIENGKFYTTTQTLDVGMKEMNPDMDDYYLEVETIDKNGKIQTESRKLSADRWIKKEDGSLHQSIQFEYEANYRIKIVGKDLAGNVGDEQTLAFQIDKSAPQIIQISSEQNNNIYADEMKFQFAIKEFNYQKVDASIKIVRVLDGKKYTDVSEKLILNSASQLFTYPLKEEGAYEITVNAKDEAGCTAKPLVLSFVLDQTKPEISIIGAPDFYKTKNPVTLNFQVRDRNHNFTKYKIFMRRYNLQGEETKWVLLQNDSWKHNGYISANQENFTTERKEQYTKEGNYEVLVLAEDLAGNIAVEKELHFTIDHTAPEISKVTYSDRQNLLYQKHGTIYSNHSILMEFEVVDSFVGVNSEKIYVTLGDEKNKKDDTQIYVAHKSMGNRYYVYLPEDIKKSEVDEVVTIWANDKLENESHFVSSKIILNQTYPTISIENDLDWDQWMDEEIVLHTKVSDNKSGIKEAIYRIDGKEVKKVKFDHRMDSYKFDLKVSKDSEKVSGYSVVIETTNNCGSKSITKRQIYIDKTKPKVHLSGVENKKHYNQNQEISIKVSDVSYKDTKTKLVVRRTLDGKTYKIDIPAYTMNKYEVTNKKKFIKEGKYKIYAISTDGAGNQKKSNTLSFVIDKTAPELDVSGVSNSSMNSSSVVIDFSCIESFYKTEEVTIDVKKTLDGKESVVHIPEFSKTQKKEIMQHTFSEDGTYDIKMSAKDEAGNVSEIKRLVFSVDQTKPEIQIVGSDNYQMWGTPVSLQFKINESYFMKNKVNLKGTVTDLEGATKDLPLSRFANTGKLSTLVQFFNEDGIYHLEISSIDEAGNQDKKEIHFTIDQTEPKIHKVSEMNGKYYQEFQLSDSLDHIFEDLTVVSYHILLNGIEYNGTDKITEEGKYSLYVDAIDELKHKTSKSIEFIVDHTPPKVIITGAKNGGIVKNSGEIIINLANKEDEITSLKMNGKEYDKSLKKLPYSEYGSYKIEVACVDKAGNKTIKNFHFIYTSPFIIPIIMCVVTLMLFGAGMYIFIRIRKKRLEKKK